jgi:protein-S-isoprenylcysteine O-methyltransferase Ste14
VRGIRMRVITALGRFPWEAVRRTAGGKLVHKGTRKLHRHDFPLLASSALMPLARDCWTWLTVSWGGLGVLDRSWGGQTKPMKVGWRGGGHLGC